MFTHHELPQDEVRRRQTQQYLDRLRRYLWTEPNPALRAELDAADADIRLYDEDGEEIA